MENPPQTKAVQNMEDVQSLEDEEELFFLDGIK